MVQFHKGIPLVNESGTLYTFHDWSYPKNVSFIEHHLFLLLVLISQADVVLLYDILIELSERNREDKAVIERMIEILFWEVHLDLKYHLILFLLIEHTA